MKCFKINILFIYKQDIMALTRLQVPSLVAPANNYMWLMAKPTYTWIFTDNVYVTSGIFTGSLAYTSTTQTHNFQVGDYIDFVQDAGFYYNGYNGVKKVVSVPDSYGVIVNSAHTINTTVNGGVAMKVMDDYYVQFQVTDYNGNEVFLNNVKAYPTLNRGNVVFDMHKVAKTFVSYDHNVLDDPKGFYSSQYGVYKYLVNAYEYSASSKLSTYLLFTSGYTFNGVVDRNETWDYTDFLTNNSNGRFLTNWSGDYTTRTTDRHSLSFLNIFNTKYSMCCQVAGYFNVPSTLVNGNFTSNISGWTNTGWVWSAGKAYNNQFGAGQLSQACLIGGKEYSITFSIVNYNGGLANVYVGAGVGPYVYSADGTYNIVVTCGGSGAQALTFAGDAGGNDWYLDSVSANRTDTQLTTAAFWSLDYPTTGTTLDHLQYFASGYYDIDHTLWTGSTSGATYIPGFGYYNILSSTDALEYKLFLVNYADIGNIMGAPLSEVITYNIDYDCALTEPVELMWVNELGGFDFYTFYREVHKYMTSEKETFKKNDYGYINGSIVTTQDSRGETVLTNRINKSVLVKSKVLTDDMSNNLSGIFKSPEVFYMEQDGTVNPVIINMDSIEVMTNKNRPDRAIYNFEFRYANDTNTIA